MIAEGLRRLYDPEYAEVWGCFCVFGAELLDVIEEDVQRVLRRVIRRDGVAAR
ncbi:MULTISPECIES: hypothetical protein [unclassified Kitasatospora]|uniref:hypothetical protein n=1 Tax=unclassified Kitasatospora TaxID=2633591 RepID=UPI0012F93A0A|nr:MULTISPECIES: hypothetical protein [unclassified Kitasatospora]